MAFKDHARAAEYKREYRRLHPRSKEKVAEYNRSAYAHMSCEVRQARSRDKYERRRRLFDHLKVIEGCAVCGYRKSAAALEWHHRDPELKDFEPGQILQRTWARVLDELDKCVCLCANCHRELHARERKHAAA